MTNRKQMDLICTGNFKDQTILVFGRRPDAKVAGWSSANSFAPSPVNFLFSGLDFRDEISDGMGGRGAEGYSGERAVIFLSGQRVIDDPHGRF